MGMLAPVLLAVAVLGCYLAVRWAGGGWVAMVLPALAMVGASAAAGHPEMALGVALGAAVAALGLAVPLAILQGSPAATAGEAEQITAADTGWWALSLPIGASVFLVGLSSVLDWVGAACLAALGLAICPVIFSGAKRDGAGKRVVEGLPGALLAIVAGGVSVVAAIALAQRHPNAPAGLIAACVLGPMSVLPLLGAATSRAAEGDLMESIGACLRQAVALLITGPVLTFIVIALRPGVVGRSLNAVEWGMGVRFPGTLWRVETVLLMVIAAALVPIGMGRFVPTRRDGLVLLVVYVGYLVVSAVSGLRGG